MDGTSLSLFGAPSVVLPNGQPPGTIGTSKSLALLAYLALENGPHTREELAALLWGDSPEAAARASLRQAIKHLREGLGAALRVDRRSVELAGRCRCDVWEFLNAAERSTPEAAGYDVPKFLAGFSLRGAPAFDEWAAMKRRWLLRRFHQVLRTLVRQAMAGSHWREASGWVERWLESEPLSDEATRLAMEVLYLSGDRGAALARFAEYRERLTREVACEPSASLGELARRIEADRSVEIRESVSEKLDPRPLSFECGLVGREAHWQTLLNSWNVVTAGSGQVILIEGEGGLGKTRLAEEFLHWATAKGATILRGRGYDPTAGIPYVPLVDALRGVLDAPGLAGTAPEWLTEATRFIPELRRRFPTLPEPGAPTDAAERQRLFESVAQVLLALAAERPTVLFLDDLQWCDGDSCGMLRFLVRRLSKAPVAIVAAITLGDLEPDAPSARLSRAMRIEPHAAVVTLCQLGEDEVWQMIREMGNLKEPTGGQRFARKIHEVTDGNPFYVIELLKALFEQGVLTATPISAEWAVSAVMKEDFRQVQMPRTVRDAIGDRISRLPQELRDLLATIAIAGRGVQTALLSHVHGISRMRAAAWSDALVERQLVMESERVYRCAHQVIADVTREQLTPARRQELHRAIALSLQAITRIDCDELAAGEIAWHAHRGGEFTLAYEYALRASDSASRRYAFEEALSWLDLAAEVAVVEGRKVNEVSRLTSEVLELAGWTQTPVSARRRGTPARGIARTDLDLRVLSSS